MFNQKEIKMTKKQHEAMLQSPFYQEMIDESKTLNVNGNPMPRGYWNLICSIRDVSLYSKGIKPNRMWKISDVKYYFNVKGNAKTIETYLRELREMVVPSEEEKEKV